MTAKASTRASGTKPVKARAEAFRRPALDRRSRWEQVFAALLSNALLGFLLASGRVDPLGLILLVACEALLLSCVEAIESRFVPSEARGPALRTNLLGRLALLLFLLAVLLGFNLLLVAAVLKRGDAVRSFLGDPLAALGAEQVVAPLVVTLLGAVIGAIRDLARFRERGGALVSTPGWNAGARWLVLVLAVLPHAVPLIGMIAFGLRWLARRNERSAQGFARPVTAWHFVAFLAAWFGTFFLVARLYTSGLVGWAFFFCVAKAVCDLVVAGAPGSSEEGEDAAPTPGDGVESPAVR